MTKLETELLDSLGELLAHIDWMRSRRGKEAGPNDCTHKARRLLNENKEGEK